MSDHEAGSRGPSSSGEPAAGGAGSSGRSAGGYVLSAGAARVLAVVVLLTIGLAGMAAGVAFDRYVILPRRFGVRPPAEGPRGLFFSPRGGRQVIQDRLGRYLDLTPAQRTMFDSLMSREERELRAAREAARPRIDSIVSETQRAVDSILTAGQREKLRKLREEGLGEGGRGFGGPEPDRGGAGGGGRRRHGGPPPFP